MLSGVGFEEGVRACNGGGVRTLAIRQAQAFKGTVSLQMDVDSSGRTSFDLA